MIIDAPLGYSNKLIIKKGAETSVLVNSMIRNQ